MRKGREFYSKQYDKMMKHHENGKSVNDITKELDISYSAVYHWVKKLRKPEMGNINEFEDLLKKGPIAVVEIKEKFSKHNELFLTATKRGLPVKRRVLGRKYGEYSTWYYIEGQEEALGERIKELLHVVKNKHKD